MTALEPGHRQQGTHPDGQEIGQRAGPDPVRMAERDIGRPRQHRERGRAKDDPAAEGDKPLGERGFARITVPYQEADRSRFHVQREQHRCDEGDGHRRHHQARSVGRRGARDQHRIDHREHGRGGPHKDDDRGPAHQGCRLAAQSLQQRPGGHVHRHEGILPCRRRRHAEAPPGPVCVHSFRARRGANGPICIVSSLELKCGRILEPGTFACAA